MSLAERAQANAEKNCRISLRPGQHRGFLKLLATGEISAEPNPANSRTGLREGGLRREPSFSDRSTPESDLRRLRAGAGVAVGRRLHELGDGGGDGAGLAEDGLVGLQRRLLVRAAGANDGVLEVVEEQLGGRRAEAVLGGAR